MNRGGFSWEKLPGISSAKARMSRKIDIPLTRSGRQRKLGGKMGCLTLVMPLLALVALGVYKIVNLLF